MAEMGRCKQGFSSGERQLKTFIFRSSPRTVAFVLFALFAPLGMFATLGCRKSDPEKSAAPATSSVSSANAPKVDATPQKMARLLALQKPSGATGLDKEIEFLQKATEKNVDSLDPWILLGRAWARKARRTKDPGYWLNVDACAKVVFEREPKHRLARHLATMVQLEQHAFADAKDAAEQLLLEDSDDLEALGLKSDAALELGQFDAASQAAQKMVDIKPNLASYARAAHLRWLQGDANGAKSIYRAAFDARDPRDPEPYAWILTEAALIFWHEGDIEGADKGFDKALEAFSDEPSALLGKARVAMAKGDSKQAIEFATRALAISATSEAYWILVDAKTLGGDAKGAEEASEKLVTIGQKSDKRTLAAYWTAKNKNIDEALKLAKEEANGRQDIHTRDVLAWAYYRKGDFVAARKEIDAAMEQGTKEPILLYHAGAIRLAQGEKAEGEKLIREALKMNPHFDLTASAEAKKILGDAPREQK